jgi:hypothetical protein
LWPGASFKKTQDLTVVPNRFDWAAIHCLLAESLLLGSLWLLVNIAVPAIVVAFEVCRCGFAAQIAVDALVIYEKFSLKVVAVFVCCVCHIDLVDWGCKLVALQPDCNRFLSPITFFSKF